jgi:hypothetical protein
VRLPMRSMVDKRVILARCRVGRVGNEVGRGVARGSEQMGASEMERRGWYLGVGCIWILVCPSLLAPAHRLFWHSALVGSCGDGVSGMYHMYGIVGLPRWVSLGIGGIWQTLDSRVLVFNRQRLDRPAQGFVSAAGCHLLLVHMVLAACVH